MLQKKEKKIQFSLYADYVLINYDGTVKCADLMIYYTYVCM